MFAVKENKKKTENEELVLKAIKRKTQLYEFWRCLLTLDRVGNGEFIGFKYDFYNLNYASQYIIDCLTKSKTQDIFSFLKHEQQVLQEFLEVTKDFEYKEQWEEHKNLGNRIAEVLEDIRKWYKNHFKNSPLDVQNGIILLA